MGALRIISPKALNLVRRHLDARSRAAIAGELRKRGGSYRAIGEKLGVDKETVRSDVQKAPVENSTGQPARVTGRDGKQYPAIRTKGTIKRQGWKRSPPTPRCIGMQYARMAILDLEKIDENDTERAQALDHVKGWIEENE